MRKVEGVVEVLFTDRATAPLIGDTERTAFLSQILPVSRNFVINRCVVVLFATSLSGHALLNASRKAPNDFDVRE
jgi:hypothetical protein